MGPDLFAVGHLGADHVSATRAGARAAKIARRSIFLVISPSRRA
jgi:hypothetical protein